ncbi:MAG: cell division protein FtsW [Clostridia bacterium]|nr:cell division protein FtsW [Clostridia bacterium]
MAKERKVVREGICLPLMLITIILTCIGLVMVFSTTYNDSLIHSNNTSYLSDFRNQAIVAVVGLLFMFCISRMDYRLLKRPKIFWSLYVASIIALIAVFFFDPVYDSHRWIRVPGIGITIQSSEIAKVVAIIFASLYTSANKWWYRDAKSWFRLLLPIGILAALIIVEPDLSTTMCLLGATVIVMFVSGMPWGFLAAGVAGIGALVPLMISVVGYQSRRFDAWLHAWDDPKDVGYQIVQSLYAIGDGGLFGVGLGNSKQKITHLPMSDTDYIFSIICEEFGFVGAVLVIGLYVAYAFFGIKIAMEASDRFGTYLAVGITTLIVLQAFINMGVATNVLPSTGLTLPFISKGASSLAVTLCSTGILLSISSHKTRKPNKEE